MTEAAATPSLAEKSSSRFFPAAVLLFILVVIPFLPALHGQFTWDDDLLLSNSPQVRAWNGLSLIWNPFVQPIQYFPLTYSTFWLEHKIWGLNTTGYHLVNMLLQGGSAILLWLSLRRLGIRAAWFAALLWAIHPVQVESIAWISERKNALSGIFYLLAAWSYLRFERIGDSVADGVALSRGDVNLEATDSIVVHRRWIFYTVVVIAFIAALLSKTLVCTFPAGMLIVLWWKREKLSWRDVAPLLPLFIIAFAFAAITAALEHRNMITGGRSNLDFTPLERVIIVGKNIWFYLRTLAFPYPLMPIYPRWTYASSYLLNYVPAAGALVLAGTLFVARNKIGKWPLAAYLFFLIALSPLLGFINFFTMHYSFVADHYVYIAAIGVLVPLAELLRRVGRSIAISFSANGPVRRVIEHVFGVSFITGLGLLTAFYASLFQMNIQLWSWNVARNPAAFTAQHNLAVAYFIRGEDARGVAHLDIALKEQPEDDRIQRTVGQRLLLVGDYAAALSHFQKAAECSPHVGLTYMFMGDTYDRIGRLPEALTAYAKAIQVEPTDARFYTAYAAALKKDRQYDLAVENYVKALHYAPGNMITRYNYANLLLDMNKNREAIEQYQFILKYQDSNPLVWHNLAAAYYQDGQMDQATAAKKRAYAAEARIAAEQAGSASKPKP